MGDTIERARGRWREILPRLGIDTRFLVNRHGPCPLCGGRDRFRFDDKDGSGSYFCGQCGPGTGLILLQKRNGWTFKEAADAIDEILGTDPPPAEQPRDAARDDTAARRAAIERVLREATSPEVVRRELHRRGLSVIPDVLRGHPRLSYYTSDGAFVGKYPAVVMPVRGPDGDLRALHRVYLGDLDPRKKLTPPIRRVTGGAIRLFDPSDTLGIAEGPETAIAAYERDGVPCWAGICSTILEGFQPPPGVRCVIIYGDNDLNFEGQRAAYSLARRLVRDGYEVRVEVPPEPDTDWLDVLNARRAAP